MQTLDSFGDILLRDEPLAPYTWLKVGGPAQFFLTPRNEAELVRILQVCQKLGVAVNLLGGGSNLLVRDEGVSGAVIRLSAAEFAKVEIDGETIRAGGGALLSHVVSESVREGLAGLEHLAGVPGTIGGAVRGNAGGRQAEIGHFVTSVTSLTNAGEKICRKGDDLEFGYRQSNLDDAVILEVELRLAKEDADAIAQRLRKVWVMKKASQPLGSQSAGCIFRNPRGQSAGEMIEQAGLKGTRIGGAEVSDRHANFIVTHPGATSDDVLRLIELIRSRVSERFGVHLELEIQVW